MFHYQEYNVHNISILFKRIIEISSKWCGIMDTKFKVLGQLNNSSSPFIQALIQFQQVLVSRTIRRTWIKMEAYNTIWETNNRCLHRWNVYYDKLQNSISLLASIRYFLDRLGVFQTREKNKKE